MALHVAMGIGDPERERATNLVYDSSHPIPSQRSDEGGEPIEPRKIKMNEKNDEQPRGGRVVEYRIF